MTDTDPREHVLGGVYQPPAFHELVSSASQLGLIDGYEEGLRSIRLKAVGQIYDVSRREAEMLLNGLLLGYFSAVNPGADNLVLAAWEH